MTDAVYQGRCFCGAVCLEGRGTPSLSGYCHCQDCRDWSGTPVTSFVMWPHDAFSVVRGKGDLALFSRTPQTPRGWCARCGGHLGAFREEQVFPFVAVGPHMFPDLPFAPAMHVFCGEAVVAVDDDLPKYRDLPESMGGSGELMPGSTAA